MSKYYVRRTFWLSYLPLLFLLLGVGCSSLPEEQAVLIEKLSKMESYPVKRASLIAQLDLENMKSERQGGSVRSGRMYFSESWEQSNGLKLTGYDSEHVGAITVTRENISDWLNSEDVHGHHDGFGFAARDAFESVSLYSKSGRILFDSNDQPSKRVN